MDNFRIELLPKMATKLATKLFLGKEGEIINTVG